MESRKDAEVITAYFKELSYLPGSTEQIQEKFQNSLANI
jgi:hypothetical protein